MFKITTAQELIDKRSNVYNETNVDNLLKEFDKAINQTSKNLKNYYIDIKTKGYQHADIRMAVTHIRKNGYFVSTHKRFIRVCIANEKFSIRKDAL